MTNLIPTRFPEPVPALPAHAGTQSPAPIAVAAGQRDGAPPSRQAACENQLLAALPEADLKRLLPSLTLLTLTFGEGLHGQGEAIRHVYFPGRTLISLLAVAYGHPALEVGLIGPEGMVGVAAVLGSELSTVAALVQGTGNAMRMELSTLREALTHQPVLQRLLLGYVGTLMAQIAQTAACNRFHVVEQRLARWLLMSSDRLQTENFRMTHEFLGHMLGVRRVGVTEAAQTLQSQHLIAYHRGDITIRDRTGLEGAACQCYTVVRNLHPSYS